MGETTKTRDFIRNQKKIHGRILHIESMFRPDKNGEPDVFSIYKGMPVYMEAKFINPISGINNHPFKEIQLDTLESRAKSGAMCIGLLHCPGVTKFITHDKLKDYLDKSTVEGAEVFDWETLLSIWTKSILTNFSFIPHKT
jgi:hypothetical protein